MEPRRIRKRINRKIRRKQPYGLTALNEFVETILYSFNLKGHKPLSALIIGYPDSGKTESLMRFANSEGIYVATDFTGYGISELLRPIMSGQIKFILIQEIPLACSIP